MKQADHGTQERHDPRPESKRWTRAAPADRLPSGRSLSGWSLSGWSGVSCLLASLLLACGASDALHDADTSEAAPRPVVVTTAWPLEWLAERLAGDTIELQAIGWRRDPDGASWTRSEPSAEQIVELVEADLILAQGAGYEDWMATASLPASRLVVTSEGLDLIEREGQTHSHGETGEHSHREIDAYTWGDPSLFQKQAATVQQALERIGVPADALAPSSETLAAELGELSVEIERLRQRLEGWKLISLTDPDPGAPTSANRYLARALGLPLQELEVGADGVLSDHDLHHLEDWLEGSTGALALWPTDPGERAAPLPRSVRSIVVDSLAGPRASDYFSRYEANLRTIEAATALSESR